MSIDKYIPEIQENLRHQGFPRYQKGQIQEVRFDLGQAPKITMAERYEFQDKEGTSGIILAPNFIALHTSKYDIGEHFEKTLKTALSITHEVVQFSLAERIGLRYVDLIRLRQGETWSEYLQPGLLGLNTSTLSVSESLSRFEFVGITDVGKLIVRYSQSEQGIILPPDLMPNTLKHDVQLNPNELVSFLDLDHFSEASRDFEVSSIMETVSDLHDNLDRAFRSAVTETALQRWGKQEAAK
jgi:uncharacterized protein (TIGR04255 family)